MKHDSFFGSDFENSLQGAADKHRVYPTERVWDEIRDQLQGKQKWPALTFMSLFIIGGLIIATMLNYPPEPIKYISLNGNTIETIYQKDNSLNNKPSTIVTFTDNLDIRTATEKTIAAIRQNTITAPNTEQPLQLYASLINEVNNTVTLKSSSSGPLIEFRHSKNNTSTSSDEEEITPISINTELSDLATITTETISPSTVDLDDNLNMKIKTSIANEPLNTSTITSIPQNTHKKRWNWQFYISPSSSYRNLEDDKTRSQFRGSASQPIQNAAADNAVKQKPSISMEVGFGVSYKLSHSLSIKAGIQFNAQQYHINASKSSGVATVNFVKNNQLESINLYADYSNDDQKNNTPLENRMYQISFPIGMQWNAIQLKKFGVSMAASIQPTFNLNKNIYLLSTDYKYYADATPFFRKFNYNTSVELNLSYNTGITTWFIGPQIRYQHLPTYSDLYPIKEHRFDYGIKIGFIKPL